MTLTKLSSFAARLAHKNAFFQRQTFHQSKNLLRGLSSRTNVDENLDKPIKFSESEAAKWKAEYNRTGEPGPDFPWFQPYVVSLSTITFLIYFCILREENDIDEQLCMPLVDHFTGAKRQALEESFALPDQIAKKTAEG